MKKVFSLMVSFAAGLGGAFTYHQWLLPATPPPVQTVAMTHAAPYTTVAPAPAPAPAAGAELGDDFAYASAVSTPSVVYIKNTAAPQPAGWLEAFFGGGGGAQMSSGSGVIYSADGYIITNHHVVAAAAALEVIHQERAYPARVVGSDPSTDLAVLKIEVDGLPAAKLAPSRPVRVGEWVLAVGNPFNLTSTVTAGIVSAKGRNLNIVSSRFPIESFIQTDAAINPGNSGGALVNRRGELVGINTAIYSQTGSYAGYGFAVPSDIVRKVVDDLIAYGEVQKAFAGLDVTDVTPELAERIGLDNFAGVIVTYLQPDGVAERAGLRQGDVILSANGQTIHGKGSYDEEMSYLNPGDRLRLVYRRQGRSRQVDLTLTNREGTTARLRREIYPSQLLGADLETVSKVERDRLAIAAGVRVVRVGTGPLSRTHLRDGFIITAIDRQPVQQPQDVEQMLGRARGRTVVEGINEKGVKGYYTLYL